MGIIGPNGAGKSTLISIRMDSKDVKHFLNGTTKSALANTGLIKTMSAFDHNYSKDELKEIILHGLDQIKVSDIEIICSIDNNHRIVHTDFSTTLNIDDDKIKVQLDYTFSGGESIFDTIGVSEMISIANRISTQFYDVEITCDI